MKEVLSLHVMRTKKTFEELLLALGDSEGHGRAKAVTTLAAKKDERSLWAFIPLLQDSFFLVRREVAKALTDFQWQPSSERGKIAFLVAKEEWKDVVELGAKAVPYLVKLLGEKHEPTAKNIVRALQSIGEPAIHPLCRIATSSDERASKRALKLLVELKDERAIPAFLVNLESARVSLRLVALRGLDKVVNHKCHEPLLGLLRQERETAVLRSLYGVLAHHSHIFEESLRGMLTNPKSQAERYLNERCFKVFEAMGEEGRRHLQELSSTMFKERAEAGLAFIDRDMSDESLID